MLPTGLFPRNPFRVTFSERRPIHYFGRSPLSSAQANMLTGRTKARKRSGHRPKGGTYGTEEADNEKGSNEGNRDRPGDRRPSWHLPFAAALAKETHEKRHSAEDRTNAKQVIMAAGDLFTMMDLGLTDADSPATMPEKQRNHNKE